MDYTRFGVSNYWSAKAYNQDNMVSEPNNNIGITEENPELLDITERSMVGGNPSEDFLERFSKYLGGDSDSTEDDSESEEFITIVSLEEKDRIADVNPVTDVLEEDPLEEVGLMNDDVLEEDPLEEVGLMDNDASNEGSFEEVGLMDDEVKSSEEMFEQVGDELAEEQHTGGDEFEEVGLSSDSDEDPSINKDWVDVETEEFSDLNKVLSQYSKFVYN